MGHSARPYTYTSRGAEAIFVADLNKDGVCDVVVGDASLTRVCRVGRRAAPGRLLPRRRTSGERVGQSQYESHTLDKLRGVKRLLQKMHIRHWHSEELA